ncbi:hypothetical protein F5X98DRAFT_123264 [Xylaria grammica]|nr:hypothetical protein F5X98DRAFT_123264 [Xylaria grammica]
MENDVAIVGVSFKMPQEAVNEASLWELLEKKKNVMTEWPTSRVNLESFYDADSSHFNKLHNKGGHFLKQDPAVFDAPFFSITAKEAATMEPEHRLTLEASYRAFENAGMTVDSLKGSRTAVFAASSSDDYYTMSARDIEGLVRPTISGWAKTMLANRVSWYFDLQGPSVHIDTACSGSMSALHMACETLRTGGASAALVAGANMILGPEAAIVLANGGYLSPDSLCYSFDHRANGYGRGEGIVVIIIKLVVDAIRDGNMIRAVIRATGANQNGRTAIMTQPSADAQEQLIRDVYQRAGLGFESTHFYEAHGTGTVVGDPAEMRAVGRAFGSCRSSEEPIYVGSIKSNVGHLEGAAGLAGIVKSMLILEKGVITPNALFEKLNPDIDAERYHIVVPTECVPWPTRGLRRISVNSFGFGGSNVHVVMDDAMNYLRSRGLTGNHCTVENSVIRDQEPLAMNNEDNLEETLLHMVIEDGVPGILDENRRSTEEVVLNGDAINPTCFSPASEQLSGTNGADPELKAMSITSPSNIPSSQTDEIRPYSDASYRLLVWSAAGEDTLKAMVEDYKSYWSGKTPGLAELDKLAFTLASRRSFMLWRSFAIVTLGGPSGRHLDACISPAAWVRALTSAKAAFVFTGQGAQYARMGLELIHYPVVRDVLKRIDGILHDLGCGWSVMDELHKGENINLPQYSQTLCTALQLALVELLKSFGVVPCAVIGHSSGEIAAAYATGGLSMASACKVAYYRGLIAERLVKSMRVPGAMLAVNVPSHQVRSQLEAILPLDMSKEISVACINSPSNSTLSGPEHILSQVKAELDKAGIFVQLLNTRVPYHSQSMQVVADEYRELLGTLESCKDHGVTSIPMVSSMSGEDISSPASLSDAQYWVDNMVSPVQFSKALSALVESNSRTGIQRNSISDLIEVGPHPALRRPIQETLAQLKNCKNPPRCHHILYRSRPPLQTTLQLIGHLFCHGYPVSINSANSTPTGSVGNSMFSVDCPEYPFNHSAVHWREPRLSRDCRLRESAPVDSLGARSSDWNPLEPRWRNFLSIESTTWAKDHVVLDSYLYPGTGMIIMALEAIKQVHSGSRKRIAGYNVKKAHFMNPIVVGKTEEESTEVIVQLRHVRASYEKESLWSDVRIMTCIACRFTECFQASIQVQYADEFGSEVDAGMEKQLWTEQMVSDFERVVQTCNQTIDRQAFYEHHHKAGNSYGETFKLLDDICWDGNVTASARIHLTSASHKTASLTHPAVLDCALQLLRAQSTNGLSDELSAFVANKITNMWIAAEGWQSPYTPSLRILAETSGNPVSENVEASIHILAERLLPFEEHRPLCSIGKITLSPVSGKQQQSTGEFNLLHTIQWKPQLSMMSPREQQSILGFRVPTKNKAPLTEFRAVLEPLLDRVLCATTAGLSREDQLRVPESLRKYVQWMQHRVTHILATKAGKDKDITSPDLEAQLQEVEELYPPWKIFPVIARNLTSILVGETDPLPIAFETGLAEAFYTDIFQTSCDENFRTLLDLLSHENPTLRILEVGAGTGGITSQILSTLKSFEASTGGMRFSEYVFTDISPSFFEGARNKFEAFASRMAFKTLDLDKSPVEQGFGKMSYDVVIAGCVLHATRDVKKTLSNVRLLLKPGGRLLYLEVVVPENVITNFAFGVLPGWWSSVETYRSLSPVITEHQWDLALRDAGYSGNDIILRDHESTADHIFSTMLSTRCEVSAGGGRSPDPRRLVVVQKQQDPAVLHLFNSIRDLDCHWGIELLSLEGVKDYHLSVQDVVVSMIECRDPFLNDISNTDYRALKDMLSRARNLLWITAARLESNYSPHFGIVQGLLRSIRSENAEKRIVSLAIEDKLSDCNGSSPHPQAECVKKVLTAVFELGSNEVEYRVHDGQILIGRLSEEIDLNARLSSLISPQIRYDAWGSGPPLKLITRTTGFLDTLEFVEDIHEEDLGAYEVEIQLRACALNFRDVFVALGRLPGEGLGYDCAGVVTRVGSSCNWRSIKPGDRVCGGSIGCMRTYPRLHISTLAKIPETLSLEAAASFITPGMTAYYSLIKIARLQKKDKILIHSAAGATGQMAIRVAQMIGAEIFATVGLNTKKDFLINEFGIPAENVFYSRNTTFARGIMRVTKGYGVDVILNSLAGDSLRASWECMAPFGRFIEIGKTDVVEDSGLPMAGFGRNVSFHAVDLHHIGVSTPELAASLFQEAMSLLFDGIISHPQPLNCYPAAEVEQAFRHLQGGRSTGRVVVHFDDSNVVQKRLLERTRWRFDPDASYVIAGGLGGLGRAISRWMVDKGAKNLVLLSRSGATSSAAAELVSRLREQGVTVAAPKCDAASAASLSAALEGCVAMPPIKGCINAAMALHDALFDNMTYSQWKETLNSKAQTSWNLHRLLPDSLDFFILLSSLSGVYGSISQSNYAAGCAFQDALARYRMGRGQIAVSLDLGWMRNIGVVAETAAYRENRLIVYNMMPIDDTELMALLDLYCNPIAFAPKHYSQLLVGPITPAQCLRRGLDISPLALRPLFASFSMLIGENENSLTAEAGLLPNFGTLFRQAAGAEERAAVVTQGLTGRLARAMAISISDVVPSKHLSDYGVDSLMAMELRNWISRDFGAHLAVFDIMGTMTISAIGELVEERSEIVRDR